MEPFSDILRLVGTVVLAGVGISLIVYQAFKHLAGKGLAAYFEEKMQVLKYAQQKKLSQFRVNVSTLLVRGVKPHQRPCAQGLRHCIAWPW